MNCSTEEAALGKAWYRRRAKVFFALMVAFLALTGCAIAMVAANEKDRGTGIVGAAEIAVAAVVFLVLWARMRHGERNRELASKRGASIAAAIQETMPDFEATNVFALRPYDRRSPRVWVNQKTGQMQFLLSDLDGKHPWKKERLSKTKCMKLASLSDIELKVVHETVTDFGGYGINPLEKTTLIAGGGSKSTRTVGHYSVEFLFDDVDLPFVNLRFDGNPDGAKKLFHAIKALKQKDLTTD